MRAALTIQQLFGQQDKNSGDTQPSTAAARIDCMRAQLLEAFLEQMNAAQIPYCVLNGFEGYPAVIASDVDFMVHPKDAERIAPLLLEVAKRCGAPLVQAIQHETGAWYFILAKQAGGAVAYLHPDCSTDYRRDGRLWLEAEQVLKKRQPYKTFFLPAIADEFLYYLTKKILKQQITSGQLQRIAALYLSYPEECSERIRRFWSEKTAEALVPVLVGQEIGWMRFYLPALLSELRSSVPVESWWERSRQRLREWRRQIERVLNPTGLGVAVCGGTEQQRARLAAALEETLRPAFRRTVICAEATTGDSLWGAPAFWLAKVRSTLVIRRKELPEMGWLERDEIGFVFTEAGVSEAMGKPFGGEDSHHGCMVLDGSRPLEQNLERATAVTLEYLAAKLRKRMNLEAPSSIVSATPLGKRREVARGTGSAK
jgi:hypothetical protein